MPPSQRSELAVPEWLDRVILTCLAKDPPARPASAETLARMFESNDYAGSWTVQDAQDWWQTNMPDTAVTMDVVADEPRRRSAETTL